MPTKAFSFTRDFRIFLFDHENESGQNHTNYTRNCLPARSDVVPEAFDPQICANDAKQD